MIKTESVFQRPNKNLKEICNYLISLLFGVLSAEMYTLEDIDNLSVILFNNKTMKVKLLTIIVLKIVVLKCQTF